MKKYGYLLEYPRNIIDYLNIEKRFIPTKLEEHNKYRVFFIKLFEELIERDYEIFYEKLSEAQTIIELHYIFVFCVKYKTMNYIYLEDKDIKHDYKGSTRKKEKFEKAKENFIKQMMENNQIEEAKTVQKINYNYVPNYQDMLKVEKEIFYQMLVIDLHIGKRRAKKISSILEDIL